MLGGDADRGMDLISVPLEFFDHWRQLHRFRSCAKRNHNSQFVFHATYYTLSYLSDVPKARKLIAMLFLTPLCYTLPMERTYWPAWEKFLRRNDLIPLTRGLLRNGRPLVVLLSQVMVFFKPMINCWSWGPAYVELLDTLGDDEKLDAFSNFLMEAGG